MLGREVRYAALVSGKAEGLTELNAFDGALLSAGIGDLNLVQVSSIMPSHVSLADSLAGAGLPKGDFVLVVYGARTSSTPGELIASAVGVGRAEDGFGVIMEAQGSSRSQVEEDVRRKVEEAFRARRLTLAAVQVAGVEHRVQQCGGVVAACVFF